jgi:hypothetical protein
MPTRGGTDYLLNTTMSSPPPVSDAGMAGHADMDAYQGTSAQLGFQDTEGASLTSYSSLTTGSALPPKFSAAELNFLPMPSSSEADYAQRSCEPDADVALDHLHDGMDVGTITDRALPDPTSLTHVMVYHDSYDVPVDESARESDQAPTEPASLAHAVAYWYSNDATVDGSSGQDTSKFE